MDDESSNEHSASESLPSIYSGSDDDDSSCDEKGKRKGGNESESDSEEMDESENESENEIENEDETDEAVVAIPHSLSSLSSANGSSPLEDALDELSETARAAVAIERHCAAIDPPFDDNDNDNEKDNPRQQHSENNPWNHLEKLAEKVETARNGLESAWRNARKVGRIERGDGWEDEEEDDDNDGGEQGGYVPPSVDWSVKVDLELEANMEKRVVREDGSGGKTGILNDNEHTRETDFETNIDESSYSSETMPGGEDDFRALYTEMMTETFGDVLEQMNREGESGKSAPIDVDVLVESLQSGIDFLDPHQETSNRKSFFESLRYNKNHTDQGRNETDDGVPVHQIRQRELGYLVTTGGDKE